MSKSINRAKQLRREMTDAEQKLWRYLRAHRLLGEKFRRQQPIGNYIVDFVHFGVGLIVEADGGQHADSRVDAQRDAWLREKGFTVLWFWDNDILINTTAVLEKILEAVESKLPLSPGPSPSRGEGGTAAGADSSSAPHRPIRSYVLRQGRMTAAQRGALERLWPRFGVTLSEAPLDLGAVFGRRAPVIVDIGFGNGDALVCMATAHPEQNFLGVDVHRPGVGSLLLKLEAVGSQNVRAVVADVNEVLARLAHGALDGVHLFFPDPWPKKRHHKRRLMQPAFAQRLCDALAPGGYVHCATDWEDYAAQMLDVLEATPNLFNVAGAGSYAERPASRPMTRFEQRGLAEGRVVRDLMFRRR